MSRDNPSRFSAYEQMAEVLVQNYSRFGMTRELALIAMQEWNHFLALRLQDSQNGQTAKIVSYYEPQKKDFENSEVF